MSMACEQEALPKGPLTRLRRYSRWPGLRLSKNSRSSLLFSRMKRMQNCTQASAHSMVSKTSAKASSGSIIQNSAMCLLVCDTSARKVGPKVQTLDSAQQKFSTASCPDTVRLVTFLKNSLPQSILPSTCGMSLTSPDSGRMVVTWNISPAPSQSAPVISGVWMQRKPLFWKNWWVAKARLFLMRVMAEQICVRGRRWARSRSVSSEMSLLLSGYLSSSHLPQISARSPSSPLSLSSTFCPLPSDLMTRPVRRKEQPSLAFLNSSQLAILFSTTTCRGTLLEPSMSLMKSSVSFACSRASRAHPTTVTTLSRYCSQLASRCDSRMFRPTTVSGRFFLRNCSGSRQVLRLFSRCSMPSILSGSGKSIFTGLMFTFLGFFATVSRYFETSLFISSITITRNQLYPAFNSRHEQHTRKENQRALRSVSQGSGSSGLSRDSLLPSPARSVFACSSRCRASSMYSKRCWYCVFAAPCFSLKLPSRMWLAASGRSPTCACLRSLQRVLRQLTRKSVFLRSSVCESRTSPTRPRSPPRRRSPSYSRRIRSSSRSSRCTLHTLTCTATLGANWESVREDCEPLPLEEPKLMVVTAGWLALSVLAGRKSGFLRGERGGESDLGCRTDWLFLMVQLLKTGPCSARSFCSASRRRSNQRAACSWAISITLFIADLLQYNQMDGFEQDSHDPDAQGTILVPVAPQRPSPHTPKKSRRKGGGRGRAKRVEGEYNEAQESSFHEEGEAKEGERNSEGKMRGADEETMVELEDQGLVQPYEFISQRSPGILSIFFPRRTWRSVTFFLSLAYLLMFLVLLAYNYSRAQTDLSWNCSLYRLQAKYFPRLRHQAELWRILLSALLHSNIAHFVLDLFALQVYGYFVEWYFGRVRYCAALAGSAVYAHLLSCLAQKTSIATTPSALLFTVLLLKACFLWEYRAYKKLYERRQFLYILLALIAGINLIPIFVVNNIDYSAQIGGAIVGLCLGVYCLATKQEEQNCKTKALRVAPLLFLAITFAAFVGLVFSDSAPEYELLAETIGPRCSGN